MTLIGANGAGETSTLKSIVRLAEPTGSIRALGRDLTTMRMHEIAALGVALVPEGRAIFPAMTVRENLTLGASSTATPTHRPQRATRRRAVPTPRRTHEPTRRHPQRR